MAAGQRKLSKRAMLGAVSLPVASGWRSLPFGRAARRVLALAALASDQWRPLQLIVPPSPASPPAPRPAPESPG
jgi:hypothetical protein